MRDQSTKTERQVKELVIAAILICARNIHQAIGFVEESDDPEDFKQRISDKDDDLDDDLEDHA